MTSLKAYNYLYLFIIILAFPAGAADPPTTGARPAPPRAVLGINIAGGRQASGPVEGVVIVGIAPGGAADDAGLRVDDVIVEIDAVPLTASSGRAANRKLLGAMAGVSPGDRVELVYLRDGQAARATLTADELDPSMMQQPVYPFVRDLERFGREFGDDLAGALNFRWRHHGLFAGMELAAVSPGLGRYFGTDQGLLVIRAPDDESIGLQDGDVIRAIGGREPNDPGHAMRILRSYEPGEDVVFSLKRDKRDREVAVRLPAPPEESGSGD